MSVFFKAVAGTLVSVILGLVLSKDNKVLWGVLTVAVCCMVAAAAMALFDPIIDFFGKLRQLGNLDTELFQVVLKSVGIGLLAEITALICADTGNSSLAKGIQILASVVIMWLALPVFNTIISLIESTLGSV